MEEKKENPKRLLMSLGRFMSDKGMAIRFCRVPDDWGRRKEVDEKWQRVTFRLDKKRSALSTTRAGGVYEFRVPAEDPDGSIYTGSASFVGMFQNEAVVAELQADEDAAKATLTQEQKTKAFGKRRLYLERLEPLRRAYWSMGPSQRMLFGARIMDAITSRSPLTRGGHDDD